MTALIGGQSRLVYQDTAALDPIAVNNRLPIANLKHLTFYMGDADSGDLFPTPPGCVAVAFQPVAITNLTTASIGASGIVFTGSANTAGWLHCLCNGSLKTGTTTTDAPVTKGNAGHVEPGMSMYLNHKSATPNTLTSGRHIANKHALRLQIFEFAATSDNDTWECTTAKRCPGVVAVAWQSNLLTEDVAVSLNAAGDVKFDSTAGSADFGWVWAWSRG